MSRPAPLAELESIYQGLACGVMVRDSADRLVEINAAARAILGAELADAILAGGSPEYVREDGTPAPYEELPRALALQTGRRVAASIIGIRRPSGEVTWIRWESVPLLHADGSVDRVVTSFVDVTPLKQALSELAESRAALEAAEEAGRVGTWALELGGRERLTWSAGCRKLFGLRPDEDASEERFWALVHPDDRALVSGVEREALVGEGEYDVRFRIVLADGEVRWIHDHAAVQRDAQGRPVKMIGSARDMTKEVHAERARAASERRFRAAFESSATGMAMSAPDGRFLAVNQALCRFLGYSEGELLRLGWGPVTHPEDRERTDDVVRRLAAGESHHQIAKRYLRSDGAVVWSEVTAAAIRDENGDYQYAIAQMVDITEKRRAEAAIQEAAVARAENAAKTRFLAGMSHELRTPLNAVLGFAQLLRRQDAGNLNDRQARYVNNIVTSGQQLLALVNDLLDMAKVEAGEMDVSVEAVAVQACVDDVLAQMAPLAVAAQVELAARRTLPGALVSADERRLRQILLNLVSNAVKFTAAGGRVGVDCSRSDGHVEIAVADTGIGIAQADQETIFQAFKRVGSRTKDVQGTGLGLALSRRLIEAMNGTISVRSVPGRGSTFTVTLPLAQGAAG